MKKLLIALTMLAFGAANAANTFEVTTDNVTDLGSAHTNYNDYIIKGTKDIGGVTVGLQAKTNVYDAGGSKNIFELSVGQKISYFAPFVGVAHDTGKNATPGSSFNYLTYGTAVGVPVTGNLTAIGLVKARYNYQSGHPEQTLVSGGVQYALTKDFDLKATVFRSYRNIEEKGVGLGLVAKF